MRPSPSPAGSTPLAALARERPLLVLDLDTALASPGPGAAPRLAGTTRALLRAVALLYPSAVISRRRRGEVAACLDGVPVLAVLGCHGAEPGFGPVDAARVAAAAAGDPRSAAALRGEAIAGVCRRLGLAAAAYAGDDPVDGEVVRWRFAGHGPADDLLRALVVARLDADGRGARWQGVVRAVGG